MVKTLKKIGQKLGLLNKKKKNNINTNFDFFYENYSSESLRNKLFINLGSGGFFHPYWTNIDYETEWYRNKQNASFINLDLTKSPEWPIPNNSIELVYCEHTIEHLPDYAVKSAFEEAFRVLKSNGVFRIVCPDSDMFYYSINNPKGDEYWEWSKYNMKKKGVSTEEMNIADFVVQKISTKKCSFSEPANYSKIKPNEFFNAYKKMYKNEFFNWLVHGLEFDEKYPGNHINWWNKEKIERLFYDVGFNKSYLLSKNKSFARPFHDSEYFDRTHPVMSIHMEAIK